MIKILIAGSQGSGKTTQAEIIAKKYNISYISVGQLLREHLSRHDKIGEEAKYALQSGELVDDLLVTELVRHELELPQHQKGFVSDSYPRSVHQLEVFNPGFNIVFHLKVSEDVAVSRLLNRRREDDTPELIRKRLGIYHQVTEPLLAYYQALGKLVEINGERSIEEVAADLETHLNKLVVNEK